MQTFGSFAAVRAELEQRLSIITYQFALKDLRFQRAAIHPECLGEQIMLDVVIRRLERELAAMQGNQAVDVHTRVP